MQPVQQNRFTHYSSRYDASFPQAMLSSISTTSNFLARAQSWRLINHHCRRKSLGHITPTVRFQVMYRPAFLPICLNGFLSYSLLSSITQFILFQTRENRLHRRYTSTLLTKFGIRILVCRGATTTPPISKVVVEEHIGFHAPNCARSLSESSLGARVTLLRRQIEQMWIQRQRATLAQT